MFQLLPAYSKNKHQIITIIRENIDKIFETVSYESGNKIFSYIPHPSILKYDIVAYIILSKAVFVAESNASLIYFTFKSLAINLSKSLTKPSTPYKNPA